MADLQSAALATWLRGRHDVDVMVLNDLCSVQEPLAVNPAVLVPGNTDRLDSRTRKVARGSSPNVNRQIRLMTLKGILSKILVAWKGQTARYRKNGGGKANEGQLSPEERAIDDRLLEAYHFVTILEAKSREFCKGEPLRDFALYPDLYGRQGLPQSLDHLQASRINDAWRRTVVDALIQGSPGGQTVASRYQGRGPDGGDLRRRGATDDLPVAATHGLLRLRAICRPAQGRARVPYGQSGL